MNTKPKEKRALLTLRINEKTKARLQKRAVKNNRTMSSQAAHELGEIK